MLVLAVVIVVSWHRNNRCDSDSTSGPRRALLESTVSPEFQIIHGSWTKRLLHTLPPSAGAVIIVIREEAENVRAAAPIRAFQFHIMTFGSGSRVRRAWVDRIRNPTSLHELPGLRMLLHRYRVFPRSRLCEANFKRGTSVSISISTHGRSFYISTLCTRETTLGRHVKFLIKLIKRC